MSNIALLYSFSESNWISCKTITANLIKAYHHNFGEKSLHHFNYGSDNSVFDHLKIAKEIVELAPEKIVFLDHRPHVGEVLTLIDKLLKNNDVKKKPKIYFHVYGDFSLDLKEWADINEMLQEYQAFFICASDRQCKLLSNFMKNGSVRIRKCHFPVNKEEFSFDPELRKQIRKNLNIPDDETVFVYTGRESLQKNIIDLVKNFAKFIRETNTNARLYLTGQFDSIGNDFLGVQLGEGHYYWYYHKAFQEIAPEIQNRIQYIGNLNKRQIQEICNASDFYVSLSVHNDEDYGMSPAEALVSGLPSILTDWGGLTSFHSPEYPDYCKLIPTRISTFKIEYKEELFLKLLRQSATEKVNGEWETKRAELSKYYQSKLSVENAAEIIKAIHSEEVPTFEGFAPKFLSAAKSYKMKKELPYWEEDSATNNIIRVYSPIYREFYACYTSEEF
jgi:glycosyltransferase involved in cell wall biosynthesis